MRKLCKLLYVFLTLFTAAVLALTAYGSSVLPDRCFSANGRVDPGPLFYACPQPDDARGAFAYGENDAPADVRYNVKLLKVFPVKTVNVNISDRRQVAVGGELVGVRLKTRGLLVVNTETFQAENGLSAGPAAAAGIRKGDTLLTVNGTPIRDNQTLTQAIENSGGNPVALTGERNGETVSFTLIPQKTAATGAYKGGLWVRDSTVGVGTLTFCDLSTGTVAALGHGVYDADTASLLTVSEGEICTATVSSVKKSAPGTPGEITGTLNAQTIGTVEANCEAGVYGTLARYDYAQEIYPVATATEVHSGPAQVLCTVTDGEKKIYDVEIKKLNEDQNDCKNMTVKITDQTLLSLTGGIVQGMSGSPIIQDGMLIGAVTHVFVNDPKSGYAIFAENMLNTLQSETAE